MNQDHRRWWHKLAGCLSTGAVWHALLLAALRIIGVHIVVYGLLLNSWWIIILWPAVWVVFYLFVDYHAFVKDLEEKRNERNNGDVG